MSELKDQTGARRTIRSFVRRTGRMTAGQERALEELRPTFGVDYSSALLDTPTLFGRDAPLVFEIGFGNGETLVQQAIANPGRDYLGIEVHEPGVGHCMILAGKASLSNLRLICHDAIDVLRDQIADGQLSRINLYFPDPWPKKRHHKRRIVQPGFLALASSKLADAGALHIATDWAPYAEHIDEAIVLSGIFQVGERCEHAGERALDRPQTKFEARGLKKGHRIVDWRLLKN